MGERGRYLIVADRLSFLDPVYDLGVCLSRELLRRGIPVDYLDLLTSDPGQAPQDFLSNLPVQEILSSDASARPFWELGPTRLAAVSEYGVVLQRKDPPVDEVYRRFHRPFEQAPPEVIQINRPPTIYELSEHLLPLRYPEYAAPTTVCSSLEELETAVRARTGQSVLKPTNTYCGMGVTFVPPDVDRSELNAFWDRWGPQAIVQPYLPAIRSSGDLRILTFNGRVLGSVLRVPPPHTPVANLHQGAIAARLDPSPRQLEACRRIAADLGPLGIHLIGIDFIGEHLTEVNITSPTLIVQINEVNGIRADVELVDELERMRTSKCW